MVYLTRRSRRRDHLYLVRLAVKRRGARSRALPAASVTVVTSATWVERDRLSRRLPFLDNLTVTATAPGRAAVAVPAPSTVSARCLAAAAVALGSVAPSSRYSV